MARCTASIGPAQTTFMQQDLLSRCGLAAAFQVDGISASCTHLLFPWILRLLGMLELPLSALLFSSSSPSAERCSLHPTRERSSATSYRQRVRPLASKRRAVMPSAHLEQTSMRDTAVLCCWKCNWTSRLVRDEDRSFKEADPSTLLGNIKGQGLPRVLGTPALQLDRICLPSSATCSRNCRPPQPTAKDP
jgi:hypothetical protein